MTLPDLSLIAQDLREAADSVERGQFVRATMLVATARGHLKVLTDQMLTETQAWDAPRAVVAPVARLRLVKGKGE